VADVLLDLPRELRSELKEPMGSLYTDADALLADAGDPLVAVGDMVTYHLVNAGRVPDLALVDEQTKRSAVETEVSDAITGFDRRVTVENPPGTLTRELLVAMCEALDGEGTTLLDVDGEEDLAALPAMLAAPLGSTVVYGQPGEGMVRVAITPETRRKARELFEGLTGDTAAAYDILGVDPDGFDDAGGE